MEKEEGIRMGPISALENFMNAWKNNNWSEMFENTQITWRSRGRNKEGGIDLLKAWFHLKDLLAFKVLRIEGISDSCVDVLLSIKYVFGDSGLKETKIKARVICENEPYKPSKDGTWGVNPIGILKEF